VTFRIVSAVTEATMESGAWAIAHGEIACPPDGLILRRLSTNAHLESFVPLVPVTTVQ
jgi:hypothetical protein